MRESAAWRTARGLALVAFGIFFLFPLLSMLEFSTRVINGGGRTLGPWENLFRDEALRTSIITSLLLALLTAFIGFSGAAGWTLMQTGLFTVYNSYTAALWNMWEPANPVGGGA